VQKHYWQVTLHLASES